MIIAEGRSANTRGEDRDNSKVEERQTAPTNQGFLHAPHPGRVLTGRWREKEPIRLTELQSKLEELTRSDPQKAEQDRIALERGGADLPSSRMIRAQKAEQDRIALERLSAELEEHTRRRVQGSTLELASDVLENPGEWLRTSNTQLGNRRPIDLMGTEEEEKVFDLLHAVDQGLF